MITEQSIFSVTNGWEKESEDQACKKSQLVLMFGNKNLLTKKTNIEYVKKEYPNAEIVGCSTSGEIYSEKVFNGQIICTAVYFEKTTIEIAKQKINSVDDSFEVGVNLVKQLAKKDLTHVLILSEGLNLNGSELTNGINTQLENKISVTGGLAGDSDFFEETVIVHNNTIEKNIVVAIGFYGKNLHVGYGSMGGWDSFGVDREVTKSEGNVLYELDGQPALELYKKYLGKHAADLPASALRFPLNLRLEDAGKSLVRTVLSINNNDGSMVFAGDIPQGQFVRLMKANFNRLVDGAGDAAEMAKTSLNAQEADLAILISCVGRKLVMKQRTEEELENIREVLGEKTKITGFYSYGEICPLKPFDKHAELHNQTMTITLFKET